MPSTRINSVYIDQRSIPSLPMRWRAMASPSPPARNCREPLTPGCVDMEHLRTHHFFSRRQHRHGTMKTNQARLAPRKTKRTTGHRSSYATETRRHTFDFTTTNKSRQRVDYLNQCSVSYNAHPRHRCHINLSSRTPCPSTPYRSTFEGLVYL